MIKKLVLSCVFLFAVASQGYSQQFASTKIKAEEVPQNIRNDFGGKFPGATFINWTKVTWGDATAYDVGFVREDALCNARFWSDGNYRWSNQLYVGKKGLARVQHVMDAVNACCASQVAGWNVESVLRGNVHWGNPHSYYQITYKKPGGSMKIFLDENLKSISEQQAGAINDKAAN